MAVLYNLVFLFLVFYTVESHYMITTPRRWTADTPTPICIQVTTGSLSASDTLSASLVDRIRNSSLIIEETNLDIANAISTGQSEICIKVQYPYSDLNSHKAELNVKGRVEGHDIDGSANITLVRSTGKIFVQTDKYIYKPGQKVQFRILGVSGPGLKVSTDPYEEIFVESPSRTRIFQWLNVDNSKGLVHLQFDLSDEVEEGSFKITVRGKDQIETRYFRVEEYVLPRYEVSIKGPKIILGSDKNVTVTLCAKYTFGQPVKGNASLSLAAGNWRIYANLTQTHEISGCHDFTYNTTELLFDQNNCHIRISDLKVSGHVNETGTEETIYAEQTNLKVHRTALQFTDTTPDVVTKPYLPHGIQVKVKYADGSPARQEELEVCARKSYNVDEICKNFTTCNKGYLEFSLPNDITARTEIKSHKYKRIERNWNDVMESSEINIYANSYEQYLDPTNSSITIYTENKLKCTTGAGVNVNVPLIYIVKDMVEADLNIQVMSRGQIIHQSKVPISFIQTELPFPKEKLIFALERIPEGTISGVKDIPLSLPSSSSPNVKVLVWLYRPDGSIIADAKQIEVDDCLDHKVDLSWSGKKGEPGSQATVSINAAPESICSLGVVDKSVELLSSSDQSLKMSSVLDVASNSVVSRWDEDQLNLEYCLKKRNLSEPTFNVEGVKSEGMSLRQARSSPPFKRRFSYNDKEALHMFAKAGFHVFTNLKIELAYCDHLITEALKQLEPDKFNEHGGGGGGGQSADFGAPQPVAMLGFAAPQAFAGPPGPAGESFNKVQATITEQSGSSESERTYFPETWLWDIKTVPVSGMYDEILTLPDAITEWVGRTVCLHPNKGVGISETASIITFTPFFVDILLPSSVIRGEILPLKMSIFNYENFNLPVRVMLEASTDYEILDDGSGSTASRSFCISAQDKTVQTFMIKPLTIGDINITVEAVTDAVGLPDCSTSEVPQKLDRVVRSLPVEAEGIEREKTFAQYICGQDITDSSTEPVAVWSINPPAGIIEGSDRAWVTVTGDLLGPSIENLGNLVRMPTGCGEQNMLNLAPNIFIMEYLEASVQTTPELREKIEAFSRSGYQRQGNYRRSDNSYSAFGNRDKEGSTWLTAFVVKSFSKAKKYIYVDENVLNGTIDWLQGLQGPDGCFINEGRVVNKIMQGGLKGGDSLLTAYVAAALAEAGQDVSKSLQCIEKASLTNNYAKALVAYTMAVSKAPRVQELIDALLAAAVSNSSSMRWDLTENTNINSALHVETAAYALLALLTVDATKYSDESRRIVRWLSAQRNGQGGFVSTQDTVVALQALATFEASQPSTTLNLKAQLTSADFSHEFSLQENNRFLLQEKTLPALPQDVTVKVQGEGCGLIQAVMRYNVPGEEPSEAFTLNVTNSRPKKDCKTRLISACTSYTLSDKASNMALIQVKVVSGYSPIKQDLQQEVQSNSPVKRYEINGSTVTFYVDEVTEKQLCVNFRVYQDIVVQNTKPGIVTVLDYYDPDVRTTQEYSFLQDACP